MKAMLLNKIAPIEKKPLELADLPNPVPDDNQILIKVSVCGVCHTDLDEIEGRLIPPKLPVVPGHQIVGTIEKIGKNVNKFNINDRVGITWLYSTCGNCSFCQNENENLCNNAKWTGKDANGGYAEFMVIHQDFAFHIPEKFSDIQVAPLLCAGVIGFRAVKLAKINNGQVIGLFGFGASAHIVIQIVKYLFPDCPVFVFTRSNEHQQLAKTLGAHWTGSPASRPPEKIDIAIDFTPIGETIKTALELLNKGGRLVINAIRKTTAIPQMDYTKHLWLEKQIQSVANVTRQDAAQLLPLAEKIPIITQVKQFELNQANQVLTLVKQAKIQAAAVLKVS